MDGRMDRWMDNRVGIPCSTVTFCLLGVSWSYAGRGKQGAGRSCCSQAWGGQGPECQEKCALWGQGVVSENVNGVQWPSSHLLGFSTDSDIPSLMLVISTGVIFQVSSRGTG